MMKVTPETLRAVEKALEAYEKEIRASALTPHSQKTYLLHATHFVRWLKDDFTPGGTLINQGPRK